MKFMISMSQVEQFKVFCSKKLKNCRKNVKNRPSEVTDFNFSVLDRN